MDSFEDNTAVLEVKKNFQMLLRSVEKDRTREARLEHREQSLKRASIEFETEVQATKQQCQKRRFWEEVECRQQLDRLLTKEEDTREELAECREKLRKTKLQYEQKLLAVQKRRTEAQTAHEEIEQSLKAKIADLMTKSLAQQRDINNLECDVSEARQQTELTFRKRDAAEEQVKQLVGCQTKLLQTELRMKELEAQVSQLSSDESVSKNVKSCLLKLPKLENDNAQLLQENRSLKEIQENTVLLREKVMSLEKKLERSEEMKAGSVNWRFLYEELKKKCDAWKITDSTDRQTFQSPQHFQDRIVELQRSNVLLMEKQGHLQASLHSTEETLRVTEEKLSAAQEQVVKETSTSKLQADFIKRLQRKLLFVTKERDGFKQILDSYEKDVTMTGPSLSQHKQVDKSAELRQIASLEAELATCTEQLLPAQMRCQLLENKLAKANENRAANVSYTSEADQKIILSLRETVASLEKKLESVEQEKNRLESINERRLLQGDYDPTKTKVIHLSMNPASMAQQRQAAELARLRAEVEQLRQKLQEKQPHSSEPGTEQKMEPSTSNEITVFKAQLTSAELKNKRLMEVFKKVSQNFREACYALLGYRIDLVSDKQYKLQSMYAESPENVLLFRETETGTMEMLENTFSTSLSDKAATYLQDADSIPAFLSSITLELFSRQTMCVAP